MTDLAKSVHNRKAKASENGGAQPYELMVEVNQESLARWLRAMTSFTEEIAQFTQTRWHEDLTAFSALAGCKSPEDAFECHRRFTEKAMTQYSDEFAKLSRMMMGLANEGSAPDHRKRESAA